MGRWAVAHQCVISEQCAHIDISPRATISAGGTPDKRNFDLPWMIQFVEAAPHARLLLMAGTATPALYMNQFIAKKLPVEIGRLDGSLTLPLGRAKVKHHVLRVGQREIPL